jgi:fibronectin-binding autotransporter adhesin
MKVVWLQRWLKNWIASNNRSSSRKSARRPSLELQHLECRTVPASLDVSSGTVSFSAATGINDNVSVSLVNSDYTVSDSADTIALTQAAINAGWTGSGTNVVTGPSAGITLLDLNLADGADTLGNIQAGSASMAVSGTGSLDLAGLLTSARTISISGESNITDMTGDGVLKGATISLLSSEGIGTACNNLIVSGASPTVTASSGSCGVFITSTDGVNVEVSASGAGNVSLTNTSGTLNVISGGIDANGATITGNISLSSNYAITLSGNIGSSAFSGTISIAGDTSGTLTSSSDAFLQNGQSLITANTTSSAAMITVNTPTSGSGRASIGEGSIGGPSGGTITIDSYGGSIVWCDSTTAQAVLGTWSDCAPQTGIDGAGSNSAVLAASNYVFIATGASSEIGTSDRPIQAAAYAYEPLQPSASNNLGSATLAAGSGGIYFVDWSPGDAANYALTLNSAIASGGGDIRVVTGQATGHGLWVDGPVWTKSGSIELYSDDDVTLQGAAIGGVYQGSAFSGTVDIEANRDADNGQTLSMQNCSSIATTNAGSSAIYLTDAPSIGGTDYVDPEIPTGGIDLENVSCGNGGTITVNAAADAGAEGVESNQQGVIIEQPNTTIYAGIKGKVDLTARSWDDSNEYLLGGIGVAGTPSNPIDYPLEITAGKIVASTTGTNQNDSGSIDIVALVPATFTVKTGPDPSPSGYWTGNSTASIKLQDASTVGPLTVASVSTGAGSQNGGTVTLTGTDEGGGVVVSGTLGSSTTGAITVNGPLSGSGTIVLGTNKLTVNQDTASEFDGVISGDHSITVGGGGTLTLTATHGYTLGTTIQSGTTLLVNGSIAASSGVTVSAGAVLGGNGGTVGNVAVYGTLAPGNISAAGVLNTGSLNFYSGSSLDADLNGTTAGSGFSQVVASGAISLNGAALNLSVGPNLSITQPVSFDILVNNNGQPITGTFANLPEGGYGTTSNGLEFQITYHGGASGNDVVVTVFPS